MNEIISKLGNLQKFEEYIENIKNKNGPITISGLSDVGKIQFAYATYIYSKKSICIVTYNEIAAKRIISDLRYFGENINIEYFPKREILTYDYVAESKELLYERMKVLEKIRNNKVDIIVTTIEAIMQKMISPNKLFEKVLKVNVGDIIDVEKVKRNLVELGYERSELVEQKGQFSIRGGIVDISITEKQGYRIELWGDEVDSIREFQISDQRSTKMIDDIEIMPCFEFLLENKVDDICNKIQEMGVNLNFDRLKVSEKFVTNYTSKIQEIIKEDIDIIKSGDYITKIDKYFNCFYKEDSNFLDYLGKEYITLLDEYSKVEQRRQNIVIENNNLIKALIEKERYVPQAILNISEIGNNITFDSKNIIYLEKQEFGLAKTANYKYLFSYRDVNYYKSEIEILFDDIIKWVKSSKKVIILAGNNIEQAVKFSNLLNEKEISNEFIENINNKDIKSKVTVTLGKLSGGFESYDLGLVVISSEELFGVEQKKVRKKLTASFKQGEKVVFADLKIGDYVVHKTHGIGQFIGVNTIKADGVIKDYIKIRYKNDDMLYIPTNDLDSIRKYIGAGETTAPRINRLGSKEWENTKSKVKRNLQEVARDLMELYAKRKKIKGFAFSKDTPWQKQFEDSFPYQETEDQLRSIQETKKDMEDEKPMDRLLCGDVGYGKTEVAIRAAFKAVMDQKQVAYLVPTTVLANQQYESFKSRMEDFAVKVELLNRFRTKKEQDEIVRKLKLGEIDVVIGTHRLLSKDVEFKDLGLLIIDEEHRFGVKDKEKIKQYKANIDVLSMTATPIPRTLHMSIVGVRDMSVIYEPPQNRRPVQTYVLEYDEEIIKEAITKELERNGQVFYLYNNVEGIEKKAIQISNLVSEANVAFAHGKMGGNELEDIMMEFVEGKTNVLVCTTILESGIDIPNANTIIVENADRLGLAQLYQIRGRVGRSDKQAYAYVTYKRDKLLTEIADKRLKAIKEFTEFGSGFKIAMRDLEIRGAGSMLGEIQHRSYGASRL